MRHFFRGFSGHAVAEIDSLPGCSQIAVVHASFVSPDDRGKGVGQAAHVERLAAMFATYLYDAAIATVDESNAAQIRIMEEWGWTKALVFKSRKTGHDVGIWVRELGEV